MSKTPEFHDLVGDEGTPEELERLRRVHDLMVTAGPLPELSPRLREAPRMTKKQSWFPRRQRGAALVLAAGLVAAAFAIGYLVGDRGQSHFSAVGKPIAMHPTAGQGTGRASILIGDRDSVGNWPLLVRVSGLKTLPKGQWYELYLTRKGEPPAYCGAFAVRPSGRTTVHFTVPYSFKGDIGWVVTTNKKAPQRQVLLTT